MVTIIHFPSLFLLKVVLCVDIVTSSYINSVI
jgi:hypothetical protein